MAPSPLSRRQLLRLAAVPGVALLAGCRGRDQQLLASRGDIARVWTSRLPSGWGERLLEDPTQLLATLRGAAASPAGLVQLWDGWATSLPRSSWQPFGAPELLGRLLPRAAPVSRLFAAPGSPALAFPWAIDPWVLLLRDRPDLARRADEGWGLLLDPSLRGRLVLPSSPRITIALVDADPQRLRQLRRAALAQDERQGLNLLLAGEAEALVLPRRRTIPLLRSDPRLTVVLPAQGSPLGWNLLLRPAGATVEPPQRWLEQLFRPERLPRLLAAGWVPPLPRDQLKPSAASLPAVQRDLLLPPDDLLARCTDLPPLTPPERERLQALWDGATPSA